MKHTIINNFEVEFLLQLESIVIMVLNISLNLLVLANKLIYFIMPIQPRNC